MRTVPILFSILLGAVFWAILFLVVALFQDSKAESWYGVNTVSRHFNTERRYNEENIGAFYESRSSEEWGYQAGFYLNSYLRKTAYGALIYQPWSFGPVKIGGFAGAGTGYRKHSDGTPRGGLSPLYGGMASVHLGWVGANVIFGTSVVALQLKVSF